MCLTTQVVYNIVDCEQFRNAQENQTIQCLNSTKEGVEVNNIVVETNEIN